VAITTGKLSCAKEEEKRRCAARYESVMPTFGAGGLCRDLFYGAAKLNWFDAHYRKLVEMNRFRSLNVCIESPRTVLNKSREGLVVLQSLADNLGRTIDC
jgi:hypothetical protein